MEALTAASVAALTIYDMCKAVDRAMVISGIRLMEKKRWKIRPFQASLTTTMEAIMPDGKPSDITDFSKDELVRLVGMFLGDLLVHYGMWFTETLRYHDAETALKLENEVLRRYVPWPCKGSHRISESKWTATSESAGFQVQRGPSSSYRGHCQDLAYGRWFVVSGGGNLSRNGCGQGGQRHLLVAFRPNGSFQDTNSPGVGQQERTQRPGTGAEIKDLFHDKRSLVVVG